MRLGLCSHPAHLRANSDFSRALMQWGPARWQVFCSHLAHLYATFDSPTRFEALEFP